MKVGLNLLHVRPEMGGGWNYIENILQVLPLLESSFHFVAYCTSVSAAIVPRHPRFEVKVVRLGSSQTRRVIFEQLILPFVAYQDEVDCIHWFANNCSLLRIIPSVVTIHDFKSIEEPQNGMRLRGLYMRQSLRHSCRRANLIAPISEVSAEKAQHLFNVPEERIIILPNPLQPIFQRYPVEDLVEFRQRLNLPPQFWLYVAHLYPHKNHVRLFEAYKRLLESGEGVWPLVLRGDGHKEKNELMNVAMRLRIENSVMWIPRLSAEEMAKLYSSATALVYPSLYEGCGIPVLEAMACGCPLTASDILTTREFAGDNALMFDGTDVDAIFRAMHQFASDSALRNAMAKSGLLRAKMYSPENSLKKLRKAYCEATRKNSVKCDCP